MARKFAAPPISGPTPSRPPLPVKKLGPPAPTVGPPLPRKTLGPPAPTVGPPLPRPKLGPPAPKFVPQLKTAPKPGAPTRALNTQRATRVPPTNPLIKAGAPKPTPQANTTTGPLLGSAAKSRMAPTGMMGEGARAGQPQPMQTMQGEAARGPLQAPPVPQGAPVQGGMGESARMSQQAPQGPQSGPLDQGQMGQMGRSPYTGISPEYDDLLGQQMAGERDRQAQGDDQRQAMRERAAGLISQVQMPTQGEFTDGYDQNMKGYQDQLDNRRSQQDQMFQDLIGRVTGKYAAETSQANGAYGAQQSNIAAQQAQSSKRLGEIGGGLSTSGLPPEVVAAMNAQNNYRLNSNVSAANQSNVSTRDSGLQRAQTAREANLGNIYKDQNDASNTLLSDSAKGMVDFLNGRSSSNARFYTANQGGVKTQGSIIDNLNSNEITLLDKMTRENPGLAQAMKDVSAGVRGDAQNAAGIQRQGMQGDVSMSNNANTVSGGITQAGIRAASSRYGYDVGARSKDYATDVGAQSKGYATDVGAQSKDYATNIGAKSKDYATDVGAATKKYGIDNKVTAPKVIHGNNYLATQPMGPAVKSYMQKVTSTAVGEAKKQKMADGTENPYYGKPEKYVRDFIAQDQTTLDKKVLNNHADGYFTGKQVGGSAPQGVSNLEAMRAGITKLESGGDYKARSKTSSAGGRYQYVKGTWGNEGGYKNAASAPPWLQDARFNKDMGRFLKRYNNDYEAASIAWFQGQSVADRYVAGDKSVLGKTDANGKTTGSYASQAAAVARAFPR